MKDKIKYMLSAYIDYGICIFLFLILSVMPFYNQKGYYHIGTDKSVFFDTCCVYAGRFLVPAVALYLAILGFDHRTELWKKLKENLSVTDWFAAGYALALILSYHFSAYKSVARWGSIGWYMGFWPQIFLVMIYFIVSKFWKPRAWILYCGLASSFAVFTLGYLNRFSIDPLGMDIGLGTYISTIGNINWYCGYLTSVFFAGAALLWQGDPEKRRWKALLMLYVAVGFGTLVSQGSDSGIMTLGIVMLVMFCLSIWDGERMLLFWQGMLLLGCACLITYVVKISIPPENITYDLGIANVLTTGWMPFFVTIVSIFILEGVAASIKKGRYTGKDFRIVARASVATLAAGLVVFLILAAVNTARPGSIGSLSDYPAFTLSAKWGNDRGATWAAGWRCFTDQNVLHKLVGVGPDAMSAYIYRSGNPEFLEQQKQVFGTSILTNAHNEWLTILVNTGIVGLISFVGMMVTGIWQFIRKVGNNHMVCACGMCLLAYTINNFVSFQQAMNVATVFSIFGIGGAFLIKDNMKAK